MTELVFACSSVQVHSESETLRLSWCRVPDDVWCKRAAMVVFTDRAFRHAAALGTACAERRHLTPARVCSRAWSPDHQRARHSTGALPESRAGHACRYACGRPCATKVFGCQLHQLAARAASSPPAAVGVSLAARVAASPPAATMAFCVDSVMSTVDSFKGPNM